MQQKKFKVTFIGAGSIGFTRGLLSDLLAVPEFQHIDVSFMDINPRNLDMVYQLCQRDIEANGLDIQIHTTLDRREALKDAKYVIDCARIGLLDAFELDVNIPLKYGVDQCVGDTLCAGGVMYAQRDIAMLMGMCQDIREVAAPGCMLLNYTNPNAMVTWWCNKYGKVPTVGLCHGVQGGHALIARALGYKQEEIDIVCAGINHMTWYLSVKHDGEELNGKLLAALEADPEIAQTEKVRIDMMKRFGYFSTESNGHLSEYVPWYRKRPDEIRRWIDLGVWINGETGGYLRVCTEGRNWFETDFPNWLKEPPKVYAAENRSHEHGSWIIESIEIGRVYRGHFNVINNGCITNLPDDCVVEVPGFVDTFGINIPVLGDLPLGCAACCQSNITVQRLAMEAANAGDVNLLRQAMMMDPLVGAVCNTEEIWQMTDEMLIAQEQWLPQYAEEIAKAKERWAKAEADGTLIPPIVTEGAARLHTKTVEEMAADKEAARLRGALRHPRRKLMNDRKIRSLRMQRQHLLTPVEESDYDALYRDLQPGMNVYWHGFGQPPVLSFRTAFDDMAYNQARQNRRDLIKGRFAGGNLGWIVPADLPLFAALYRKPMKGLMDDTQTAIMTLITQLGPLNIQQIKEETGLLVKQITPALHRLQEAFLLYEDQYDGEWDRAWYRFEEMFPETNLNQYTREEALELLLQRFAYRTVWFDTKMARSFYKLPERELKASCARLTERGILTAYAGGYLRREDQPILEAMQETPLPPVLALHRNDPLVRMMDHDLKARFKPLCDALPYDHDPLHYLLVEGELRGVSVGHFRYGPYEIHDIVCDSPDMRAYREDVCAAVLRENPGAVIQRFMGEANA